MAMEKSEETKRITPTNAKLYAYGGIPLCEGFLGWRGYELYSEVQIIPNEEDRKKVLEMLASIRKANESIQQFLQIFPAWKEQQQSCIDEVNKLADNVDGHHRNTNIVQLPISGLGIAGGAMTITGLALIPFTFGVSLGLTIAGIAAGSVAAAGGVGNSVADLVIRTRQANKAKEVISEHKALAKEMRDKIQQVLHNLIKVDECATQKILKIFSELEMQRRGEKTKFIFITLKWFCTFINNIITAVKAARALYLLQKGCGLHAACAASCFSGYAVATTTATKVALTTTGKVFTGFGYFFSAAGILVDVIVIGATVTSLAKGSKTSTTKQLRKVTEGMEKEIEFSEQMYKELKHFEKKP